MSTDTTSTEPGWYQISADWTLDRLGSSRDGLSEAEVTVRLETYGTNELEDGGGRSSFRIFLSQFRDLFTAILIVAAVVSAFLEDWIEAVAILAIIILNAVMGFVQEKKAEEAMAALKRMAVPEVTLVRSGETIVTSANDIVPGDILVLETGNIVPADGRLIEAINLEIEEAPLTGESVPVGKEADRVYTKELAVADRRNLVFRGTTVTRGRGVVAVTDTGMQTELGRIAEMLQSVVEERTPLQRRLDHLAKVLAIVALAIVALLFVIGIMRGESVELMLLTSVSLAVAAIPEAMPAVVTIALSLGAQRMLQKKALIRRLPAVETLGSVSVICTDKTGTLTENRMTVTVLDLANEEVALTGESSGPLTITDRGADEIAQGLEASLAAGALCNDATLTASEDGNRSVGDPTETALVLAAAELQIPKPGLEELFPRVDEVPFDSARKRMTTIHSVPDTLPEWVDGVATVFPPDTVAASFTKGAVERIIERSSSVLVAGKVEPMTEEWERRITERTETLAATGTRVLAVAARGWDTVPSGDQAEQDLAFIGLFGLMDPPRPEVSDAVATAKSAGISTVMITGDHPLTARHIATQVGIEGGDDYLIGSDIDRMDDSQLAEAVQHTSVFARVSPEHKLRLISAYREDGEPTAMTGDGVNDAPALKRADIGVAMGITGTDVSKEAADMVLLDDNFATIVSAVEQGRVIYDNIRKFIKYLLTCNASELAVMIIGPFLGMPIPLLPLQILWMNLVTDGLPALALGVEPPEDDVMDRSPRSANETIFGGGVVQYIGAFGSLMAALSLLVGWLAWNADDPAWRTMLFTTLIFGQLALALEVRTERKSLFSVGLFSNRAMLAAVGIGIAAHFALIYVPFLQNVFGTVVLGPKDLLISLAAALAILVAAEMWKLWERRHAVVGRR
ncbi:MAG: cation-translocating P-type ATPase [Actinomycetota bacterium]|nr:cation-translocating P-type ATPase [Actinomycetota bacterium]